MTRKDFQPIGSRFGRLVVQRELPRRISPSGVSLRMWECKCDCGKVTSVATSQISGVRPSRSCGCLIVDRVIERSTVHGSAVRVGRPPEYEVWRAMRRRCWNKKCPDYQYYGALGVTICERWDSFPVFYADMGPRPSSDHSIDRYPDNDGDYEPGNCRWATATEQSRNRRSMGGNWRCA